MSAGVGPGRSNGWRGYGRINRPPQRRRGGVAEEATPFADLVAVYLSGYTGVPIPEQTEPYEGEALHVYLTGSQDNYDDRYREEDDD